MTEVIVIMNQKGGVGKTTTSLNLAAGYNHIGYRVLAIDLDPQGHLSKFSKAICDGENTLVELLSGQATFEDTIQKVGYGDILPADSFLSGYLMKLTNEPTAPFIIKSLLEPQLQNYDRIIIDCPAVLNQLTIAAFVAANKVIIPTEAEILSVDGVKMISETVLKIKKHYNPTLCIEGFLLVKCKERLNETTEVKKLLETAAKDYFNTKIFDTTIRSTVAVPESQRRLKSIYEYAPKSTACHDYIELIKELEKAS